MGVVSPPRRLRLDGLLAYMVFVRTQPPGGAGLEQRLRARAHPDSPMTGVIWRRQQNTGVRVTRVSLAFGPRAATARIGNRDHAAIVDFVDGVDADQNPRPRR